jgi:hypothetical protein
MPYLLAHRFESTKEKAQMLTSKRVGGKVEYNNGEFAEVLTYGIEGIEKDLLLETIQIHVEDTEDEPAKFQQRFPVGTTLSILTITEITVLSRTAEEGRKHDAA